MKIIQYGRCMLLIVLITPVCFGGCANDADIAPQTGIVPQIKGEKMEVGKGMLTGRVTWGPISPIEGTDMPSSVPAPDIKLQILSQKGQEIESVVTDSEGKYSINLPAGSYRIETPPLPSGFTRDLPATVTITENKETHLDIRIDTGIR